MNEGDVLRINRKELGQCSFPANIFNRERKANKRGRGNKWGTALSKKFIKGSPTFLLESIIH